MRHITLIIAVVALALAAPGFSGKGGNPNGGVGNGGGNGGGGGNRGYTPTLVATPNVVHYMENFTVSGCGYDTTYGNVVISFTGGGWGSPLDGNGCFSIPDIPASALPGTYPVIARQNVDGRWTEKGETSVTVLAQPA
jgi:hypothetical protein